VLGNESEIVEDEGPLEAVEVRKHGSDDDRRKPPAITGTKHRDRLHAHLNGFGASRAVRFAYASPGRGLSHRDVSAGLRKESNCWPANGRTHDLPARPACHRSRAHRWARRGASGRHARGANVRAAASRSRTKEGTRRSSGRASATRTAMSRFTSTSVA